MEEDQLADEELVNRADDYTNKLFLSDNKVVIVAKVALGKGSVQYCNSQYLTEPPDGYDSVSCPFSSVRSPLTTYLFRFWEK